MTGNRHDHRHFDLVLHLQTREDSTLTRSSEESNSAGTSKNQVGWIRSALYVGRNTNSRSYRRTIVIFDRFARLPGSVSRSLSGWKARKKQRIDQLSTLPCKTSRGQRLTRLCADVSRLSCKPEPYIKRVATTRILDAILTPTAQLQ